MPDDVRPTLYPSVRYRDCPAAIDFLERAFGFRRQVVHENADGTVAHAQLVLGTGVLMCGSRTELPEERETLDAPRGIYVAVDEVDAHHDRAAAAGAEIVRALNDTDYGSREYSALDPEGRLWSFGTYRPGIDD